MVINEDMLSAINKTANELGIPVKVVSKIYEEQVHYLEFMMSQFSIHEQGSHMSFKIPYICNFYVRHVRVYLKKKQHEESIKYHKYIEHENKRIERLFNTHPKHVKFIKSLRRARKSKWGFIADSDIQRSLEKRSKQRERKSTK